MKLARAALVVVVSAGMAAAPAQAQIKKGDVMLGPWAGGNFSTVSVTGGPPGFSYPTLTAATVGLQLQRALTPAVFLRIGGFYSGRGSKVQASTGAGTVSGTINVNYIEFPLVIGFRLANPAARFSPYVTAGEQTAFESGCTVSVVGASADCNSTLGGSAITSVDVGLTVGAGFDYSTGKGRTVMVDARYLDGLTNLISTTGTSVGTVPTIKNRGITLAIGYMFTVRRM